MTKTITSVTDIVAAARAQISEVSTEEALGLFNDPNVVFVDIRERQRGKYIPNSFHCPRGMAEFWVDPKSPYHKEIFSTDKRFILYCAVGWRSALTAKTLNDMGFPAAHLKDGLNDWIKLGGAIAEDG